LAEISPVEPQSLPWASVYLNRTNRRWATLYGLARLFLKREWQATHHDGRAGQGITLLFPMNDLFEGYVAALAKRALRGTDMTVHDQGGGLFCLIEEGEGGARRFQTRPDILVKRGGRTVLVLDTKWKRIGLNPDDRKHGVSQADVYQMMAYGRIYQCRNLLLLYPHHAALGQGGFERGYAVTGCNDRLGLMTVDLQHGAGDVAGQLAELCARCAEPVKSAVPG
jgi:5-methylcytosine-specific restriction enzyme subunit McrC